MKPHVPSDLRSAGRRTRSQRAFVSSVWTGRTARVRTRATNLRVDSSDQESLQAAAIEAEKALKVAALAASEAATHAMHVAEVLSEVIAVMGPGFDAGSAARPPGLMESLSPRQREVLALVAEGYSNRTIAETLFVSPNTVKTHVASLLAKLHADTRVQLAAIAVRYEVG